MTVIKCDICGQEIGYGRTTNNLYKLDIEPQYDSPNRYKVYPDVCKDCADDIANYIKLISIKEVKST